MAEQQKKSFPMLPIAHWWALRRKFKQSIPGIVTDNYLATVLDMEVNSARANVLPFLKTLGIIDEEGKTLERAKLWRDDGHYPEVCELISKEVYPKDLLEAVTNPDEERDKAERWFSNHTGAGEAAARRMAALYAVLLDADPSKQPDQEKKTPARKIGKEPAKPKREKGVVTPRATKVDADYHREYGSSEPSMVAPGIHINLEIHISADATPDQIDQVFASMAKRIYKRG